MWEKGGLDTEERARGWDWVDVIRHLSQTGSKDGTPIDQCLSYRRAFT